MLNRTGNQNAALAGSGRQSGFTLLELMVVVAIVAILATIAIANYSQYAFRARRADGQELLQHIAAAQERYYSSFNQYTANVANLGYSGTATSDKGYYQVALAVGAGSQSFTATATPQGAQASDKCGNLAVTNTGKKSFTGNQSNGDCWG